MPDLTSENMIDAARRPCIELSGDESSYNAVLDPRRRPTERLRILDDLPGPHIDGEPTSDAAGSVVTRANSLSPQWNSVALFFNLNPSDQPGSYTQTTTQDVKEWLDEGPNPASPTISQFMARYWNALSYGSLSFGVNTPRDNNGDPLIPTVSEPGVGSSNWRPLINLCLDANPEAIWKAAGGLQRNGKRWIPSVVLVQHYPAHASANFRGYDRTIDGITYRIGDRTHIKYELGGHASETIGYVAVGTSGSNGVASIANSVTDQWSSVRFGSGFSGAPVVLACMQTFNGSDPAGVRLRNRSDSEIEFKIEDEQSLNQETSHVAEDVGYFVSEQGSITDASGNQIGEAGTVTTDQADNAKWHTVRLNNRYTDPVVLMQLMSHNGSDPSHTRIRNVDSTSFDFQIEEWDYLNQRHVEEAIGYVVLESGTHQLADGREIDVGTTRTDNTWESVSLSGFSSSENVVVLSQSQTRNGKQAIVTRQRSVTHNKFDVRLQEEERNTRRFWGKPLAHEYAHNFLEFGDLYGPTGATLYWDLLGDVSFPGSMSEVSSVHKERAGWMSFKETIEGPSVSMRSLSLKPFTTTGEAYKIVPDPQNNPHEYFVLEYRKSTGSEAWRPDGGLDDEGLLITHINDRLGIPNNWLLRDAPYFDPEYAGASDKGTASRSGPGVRNETDIFYPQPDNDAFAPDTTPSSDFYGDRPSGLRIRNIQISDNEVKFDLGIWGAPVRRLWNTSSDESQGVVGRFTSADRSKPEEVFIRYDDRAALLETRDSQWFAVHRHDDRIGEWNLRAQDREVVGDLDGDGRDEIYIRSNNWAGVIEWRGNKFHTRTLTEDRVGEWNLRTQDREFVGDFDGNGRDEVYVRSNDWAGVIALEGDDLVLRSIQHDRIGEWNLRAQDRSYVGRFTQEDRDEIMVRSNNWIGLLHWDGSANEMRCEYLTSGWVDGWNLGSNDEHAIGDFDGDGRDEIYIRSDNWAGVMKWKNGRFSLEWIKEANIQHYSDGQSIDLEADDASHSGHFLPNPVWSPDSTLQERPGRDGVLHVSGTGTNARLSLLTWEGDAMKVRFHTRGGRIEWTDDHNQILIGDFHPRGRDPVRTETDYQGDRADDVFVHNPWGTGMIGINHVEFDPEGHPRDIKSQMSLTWKQKGYLLSRKR